MSLSNDRLRALIESDPEAARKLLEEVSGKLLIPHSQGQQEVLEERDARFLALCAGRRWGKTKVGAARALKECRKQGRTAAWIAPTYRIVKRGYREVLSQLPAGTLTKPAPPENAFDAGRAVILEFKNRSRLEFYSAERPEAILGASFDFVVMDEAAIMAENVWTQVVRPTLADRQGSCLFISTPRGRNWFYRVWAAGQDELETSYRSWRFPSWTNPTIPAQEWEDMRGELPQAMYEQEVMAEFISNAANVFRFDESAFRPLQQPLGHVIMGVDLAKHHDFTVFCGVRAGDRQPCYHDRFNAVSWPEQRRRLHSAVEEILKTASGITVMLDSTGIGDVIFDDLSAEGLDVVPIRFTPQWKQMAVSLLAADLERGDAFIHEDQRKEFESYTYVISSTGRWKFEASSGHDDEVSAALLAHWGVVHAGVPDVKLLTASQSDAEFDIIDGEVEEETTELRPPSHAELLANPALWH